MNFFLEHSEQPWATVLYIALWACALVLFCCAAIVVYGIGQLCYLLYCLTPAISLLPSGILGVIALISAAWGVFMLAHGTAWRAHWWLKDKQRRQECLFRYSDHLKRRISLQDRSLQ